MWIIGVIAGSVLGLTLWVLLVLKMIAVMSGWSLLAKSYRATTPPDGNLHERQTLYGRGRSRYIQAIDMYIARDGLYLVMRSMVLSLVQPPLFLPWAELHEHERGATAVRIGVGNPEKIQIRIPKEIWAARPAGSSASHG